MRLFKSEEELEVMRRAGEISALAHTRAMENAVPGCSNTSWKAKFTTNSTATARVSLL
jgi:Xaa-Pro aminopeptidase